MNEIAGAIFIADFGRQLQHFEGMILFGLILYWVGSSYREFQENWLSSLSGRGVLAAALLFGAGYSYFLVRDAGGETLLLAIALGLGLAMALLDLNAAAGLLCSLLYLRPWELLPGNDYLLLLPKFTFVLCATHGVLQLVSRRIHKLGWNHAASYLLLFGLWAYLSTFKASDPSHAQVAYFETLFKSLVLFFVLLNTIWTRHHLKVLIGTLLITFVGVGAISLSQTLGLAIRSGEELRLIGIGAFRNSNDVAAIMVLVFPFALMPLVQDRLGRVSEQFFGRVSPAMKALALAVLLLVGSCIWMSRSRGAMIGLALSLGFFLFLKVRSRWLGVAFVAAVIGVVFAYAHYSSRSSEDLSESRISREIYIRAGVAMAAHNPLLGVGYDGYDGAFEHYANTIRYEWGYRTAHNSWVLVAAETGLPGLLLFIAAFIEVFKDAKALSDSAPEYFLSVVGYGAAITFLSHSYLFHLYLLYALVGIARRVIETDAPGARVRSPARRTARRVARSRAGVTPRTSGEAVAPA